jgi:hypothetical protein
VAATIVAHAKLAENATKLQGKSAAQVAQLAPAPASLGGYLTVKSAPWSLNAGQASNFTAVCDAGQKAISGGFDNPQGFGFNVDTRPTPDGGGWQILMVNASNTAGASGSIYAVCLR